MSTIFVRPRPKPEDPILRQSRIFTIYTQIEISSLIAAFLLGFLQNYSLHPKNFRLRTGGVDYTWDIANRTFFLGITKIWKKYMAFGNFVINEFDIRRMSSIIRAERSAPIFVRITNLIRSGKIRWQDRPLWYDAYVAHPPFFEPAWNIKLPKHGEEVRKIFYHEDVERATRFKQLTKDQKEI